jgi:hypothetical protein
MVDDTVEPLVAALRRNPPELVINIAESFAGKARSSRTSPRSSTS